MDKWTNRCARIDLPADVSDGFADALMGNAQRIELGITAEGVGTLTRFEVTADSKYVSANKLKFLIEDALGSVESQMNGEYDAAFVTYWEETGYAPHAKG